MYNYNICELEHLKKDLQNLYFFLDLNIPETRRKELLELITCVKEKACELIRQARSEVGNG